MKVEKAEELVRASLDRALREEPHNLDGGVTEDGLGVHRNMRVRNRQQSRA